VRRCELLRWLMANTLENISYLLNRSSIITAKIVQFVVFGVENLGYLKN